MRAGTRIRLQCLAAAAVALSACSGGDASRTPTAPSPSTGSLTITIGGLPGGSVGAVTVSGPAGFSQAITGTSTIPSLVPGLYTIAAAPITVSAHRYDPSPPTQTVSVTAGSTSTVSVAYEAKTGLLAIQLNGVPNGGAGAATISGPAQFMQRVTSTITLAHLVPGLYTIAASEITASGYRYDPSPRTQTVSVTAAATASVSVSYEAKTGALSLAVMGLPSGSRGSGVVSGPAGFSLTFTESSTMFGLSPGSYTISATPVSHAGFSYHPSPSSQSVAVTAAVTTTATIAYSTPAGARSLLDRPDDVSGNQIHVVYAVPSDGADRSLDVNGALRNSVAAWQNWLSGQTGGRRFRLDTYQGTPDITFLRLARSDSAMKALVAFIRDSIEAEMSRLGRLTANKLYAVYYDGGSVYSCGGGAWPPQLPGVVGAMYLKGTPPGAPPCSTNALAASPNAAPGYFEFGMLHEIMHTLGIVSPTAPNHVLNGHVNTSPSDLMYAGPLPWRPTTLDLNRQNYYNPAGLPPGIINFANSPFLLP